MGADATPVRCLEGFNQQLAFSNQIRPRFHSMRANLVTRIRKSYSCGKTCSLAIREKRQRCDFPLDGRNGSRLRPRQEPL